MKSSETIVEGVTIDRKGVVHVAAELEQPLCDFAIALQSGGRAVDVQHVLAAIVMAVRDGKAPKGAAFAKIVEQHEATIARYVELLFKQHGGEVCGD